MGGRSGLTAVLLGTLFIGGITACGAGDIDAGDRFTTTRSGDTVIVTTLAGPPGGATPLTDVRILWRSDSLNQPTQVAVVGSGTLAVADRERIWVLGEEGAVRGMLGRDGEGPGEFRELGAIGGRGDSIVGLDLTNRRFALFHAGGQLLASGPLTVPEGFVLLVPSRVAFDDDGLLVGRRILLVDPRYGDVVRYSWHGDTATIHRVTGQPNVYSPSGSAMAAVMFGPKPTIGIGVDGRLALTDGVDYCIDTFSADGAAPMRICRMWERVRVTAAIRNPDYEAVIRESGRPAEMFTQLREILALVTIPERRNAIDGLFWDSEGRLWVQVVDARSADIHPILSPWRSPDRLPPETRWDVFAPDGRLIREFTLPRVFTPFDATASQVVGLYETAEGDLAVAAIRLPPSTN